MPPKKQKQRQPAESDSESEEVQQKDEENEKQDEVIMGFNQNVDEFGNVDFDQEDDNAGEYKAKKEQNFVRKYLTKTDTPLDLHFQQRTSRKCLTLIQGLPDDLDFKKIVRQFKKAWCCNGTIVEHE